MKKTIVCIILVLFVSACQVSTVQESALVQALEPFARDRKVVQNITTLNYAFYRPFHVGVIESAPYSAVLRSHNEVITFNVDVVGIIARKHFRTTLNRELRELNLASSTFQKTGEYKDLNGFFKPFELVVSHNNNNNNNRVNIMLRSYHVVLSANVAINVAQHVTRDMMVILMSSSTTNHRILSLYSHRDTNNELQTQSENLFNQLAPESGTLADMINLLKGPPTLEELLRDYQSLPNEEIVEGEEEGLIEP